MTFVKKEIGRKYIRIYYSFTDEEVDAMCYGDGEDMVNLIVKAEAVPMDRFVRGLMNFVRNTAMVEMLK